MQNTALYIHWPFCKSLCPYCDFNSHIVSEINYSDWTKAYIKELDFFLQQIEKRKISSVFFGGGTPSLMEPKMIEEILSFISKYSSLDNIEITLEANPTSSEASKFYDFKKAGINRLSIGIQSLIDEDLKFLGRKHNANEGINTIELARNIFDNFSFDLIYARPKQTIEAWEKELKQALSFKSKHISLYQLTIEKGTPFYKLYNEKKFSLPSEEVSAELFDLTNNMLKLEGYNRYEISNYAKPNFESNHNLSYWNYDDYIGIGPGAHSRISNFQEKNKSAIMTYHLPVKWLKSVFEVNNGIQKIEPLTSDKIISEMIIMNLRTNLGINFSSLEQKTNRKIEEIIDINYVKILENENLAKFNDISLSLTNKGMNLHNYIVTRILKE